MASAALKFSSPPPPATAKVLQFPAGKVAAPVVAQQVAKSGLLKTALRWGTTAAKLASKVAPFAKRMPYIGTALTAGSLALGAVNVMAPTNAPRKRNLNPETRADAAKPGKQAKRELMKGNIAIGEDTAIRNMPAPKPEPCNQPQTLSRRLNKSKPRKKRASQSDCNC